MDDIRTVAASAGVAVPALGARGGTGPAAAASDPGSAMFSAVQDLGLRLDSKKSPMDLIVIDHLEKLPTEN
jgi:uncharacterized protein (TIGR03435 family)